jgi:hypothetical protein
MKRISGYLPPPTDALREEPTDVDDLIVRVDYWTDDEAEHAGLFATKEEATIDARRQLKEMLEQARAGLDSLSKPYIHDGSIYVCSPAKMSAWIAEARQELSIAGAGLQVSFGL